MTMDTANDPVIVESPSLNARFHGDFMADGLVERFRNVKYGAVEHRFSLATRYRYGSDDDESKELVDVDNTRQGAICPQPTPYKDTTIGIPEDLLREFELLYDEFECLNLMVTRPRGTKPGDKLPVVIWIHGGGNIAGNAYRTVCDPTDWVAQSIKIGKPVMFVSIQFRVHLFGSLPYQGNANYIFHDQRLAIEWVYDNIGDFGGDRQQISLIGQSSGSCNVAIQACAKGIEKFVKRAAVMSGSINSMPSISLEEYELKTKKLAESIDLKTIDDLQTVPWEDLVAAGGRCNFNIAYPADDGKFLDFGEYGKCHILVESILISDCIEDGYFFIDYMTKDKDLLYNQIRNIGVDEKASRELMEAYNMKQNDEIGQRLGDILTDAFFCKGNELMDLEIREGSKNKVYRQFFDAVNPFDPNYGNNHMVEVIYLFNAYSVCPEFEHITKHVQSRWIDFFHGKDPWDPNSILVVSHKEADKIKTIPFEQRNLYRRIDLFPLLSKIDKDFLRKLAWLE